MEQYPGLQRNNNGLLAIDDVSVNDIADEFGTPLFVVSENNLKHNFGKFKQAFISEYGKVAVAYSYKTNYLPAICKVLNNIGAWAEVASGFEMHIAKKIGVDPSKIIFNGPAKTDDEIALAVSSRIRMINIDSLSELHRIKRISENTGGIVNLGIRLRHEWDKFGIDVQSRQAIAACKTINSSENLRLVGLHAHGGTQLANKHLFEERALQTMDFASTISKEFGMNIEIIDLGGGFAVPDPKPLGLYAQARALFGIETKTPTLENYAQAISSVMKDKVEDIAIEKPLLVLEPGRAIVSDAVFLLVKVISVKPSRLFTQLITDGGSNLLPSAPYREYPIVPVLKRKGEIKKMNVSGPLCMQIDYLGKNRRLPPIKEGDLLLVPHAGAYTQSLSTQFIKPRAGAVLVSKKRTTLVRKQETFDHILALDNVDFDAQTIRTRVRKKG